MLSCKLLVASYHTKFNNNTPNKVLLCTYSFQFSLIEYELNYSTYVNGRVYYTTSCIILIRSLFGFYHSRACTHIHILSGRDSLYIRVRSHYDRRQIEYVLSLILVWHATKRWSCVKPCVHECDACISNDIVFIASDGTISQHTRYGLLSATALII